MKKKSRAFKKIEAGLKDIAEGNLASIYLGGLRLDAGHLEAAIKLACAYWALEEHLISDEGLPLLGNVSDDVLLHLRAAVGL